MLGKNYKIFKLISGEMMITEITDVTEDGYVLITPASIVPMPPKEGEQQQQQQIGFAKFMPFSDSEEIILDTKSISVTSKPQKGLLEAYVGWSKKVREMESGIIIPDMKRPDIPGSGKAVDFKTLNTALRRK